MSRRISHLQSHASLLRDVSAASAPSTRSRLDAIVVPAARPNLQRVIDLSAALSVPLVVLCSRQAKANKIAERVDSTFGARGLIVDVPDGYELPDHEQLTSELVRTEVKGERSSDLSVKRNIGLWLARLRGWSKILFVDDDIYQLHARDVTRLAGYLDRHPVAAMASRHFPDNSVVCHARRLAGLGQDVFVSGAVLGVNTQYAALSFFPDIYNEDWFFFARHAAARALPKIGEVRQDEYHPFADPYRAQREEFGDLLAEGLYAWFDSTPGWDFGDQLAAATSRRLWALFQDDRQSMIAATSKRLLGAEHTAGTTIEQAQRSLEVAEEQLGNLSPELCGEFIDRWQADEQSWQALIYGDGRVLGERDALDRLGLHTSYSCGYGSVPAPHKIVCATQP